MAALAGGVIEQAVGINNFHQHDNHKGSPTPLPGGVIEQAVGINNFHQHDNHKGSPTPLPFTTAGGIQLGEWSQPTPVQIEIIQDDGTITWIRVPYTTVVEAPCETVNAGPCTIVNSSATVKSALGSTLSIVDIYLVATTAEVVVKRTVTVLHAAAGDEGFSSRWSLGAAVVSNGAGAGAGAGNRNLRGR